MVLVWQPITDLPQDWSSLTDGELGPLLQFWNDQRADLEQSGALSKFSERLAREWSIETGQIEGVYNLDRGVTQTLIEHGINADLIGTQPGQKPPELIAAIIQDHQEVLEGLFPFVKGDRSRANIRNAQIIQRSPTEACISTALQSRLIRKWNGCWPCTPNMDRKVFPSKLKPLGFIIALPRYILIKMATDEWHAHLRVWSLSRRGGFQ